ncbi:uncharacterized protein [Rutidosis leptorrhynchoides]|uniref:uncharacterized protein n=1 Tax=Rutidosis leptorrhynchoides TaxID=125765 RepID=UPI003A9A59C7
MGTKVKGIIRGIKNISSQIFEDEKEQEIIIGQPTDVKHVSHIGCDGAAAESPRWMKGFDASKDCKSGPLDTTGSTVETPDVNWVSEDSTRRRARKDERSHRSSRSVETSKDLPLLPRSTKNRHRSMDNAMATEALNKDSSSNRSRHTRRHHRGSRRSQDQNAGDDDSKTDIRKKSSRRSRKSKEESSGEGSTRSSTKSVTDESEIGADDV